MYFMLADLHKTRVYPSGVGRLEELFYSLLHLLGVLFEEKLLYVT